MNKPGKDSRAVWGRFVRVVFRLHLCNDRGKATVQIALIDKEIWVPRGGVEEGPGRALSATRTLFDGNRGKLEKQGKQRPWGPFRRESPLVHAPIVGILTVTRPRGDPPRYSDDR